MTKPDYKRHTVIISYYTKHLILATFDAKNQLKSIP